MATFVLVHAAWHGGWCWKKLTPLLRAAGHDVYATTLTGLGERSHLTGSRVDLDTHVQDIMNVLEFENLHDVILVGHSYGGMVITGVAQRAPTRLAHLIYLDASFPIGEDRSVFELMWRYLPEAAASREAQVRESGDRWLLPPPTGDPLFGVSDEGDLQWLRPRLTAQPVKTLYQRVGEDASNTGGLPCTYIECPPPGAPPASPFGAYAQRMGWDYHVLAGGHDVMVTMPRELSALLSRLATATP